MANKTVVQTGTVKIMNALTKSQEKRIIESIAECDRIIDKEGKRNPELRPKVSQCILDHAISHKEKLIRVLAGGMEWHELVGVK